jgi:hypothetical protein
VSTAKARSRFAEAVLNHGLAPVPSNAYLLDNQKAIENAQEAYSKK